MTYGKTPFQSITNQITKLHAIIDTTHKIEFPDISEKDLLDVLKVSEHNCTVLVWRERNRYKSGSYDLYKWLPVPEDDQYMML